MRQMTLDEAFDCFAVLSDVEPLPRKNIKRPKRRKNQMKKATGDMTHQITIEEYLEKLRLEKERKKSLIEKITNVLHELRVAMVKICEPIYKKKLYLTSIL